MAIRRHKPSIVQLIEAGGTRLVCDQRILFYVPCLVIVVRLPCVKSSGLLAFDHSLTSPDNRHKLLVLDACPMCGHPACRPHAWYSLAAARNERRFRLDLGRVDIPSPERVLLGLQLPGKISWR
jgi:hypothetical protein